jgi:hypothetical protein
MRKPEDSISSTHSLSLSAESFNRDSSSSANQGAASTSRVGDDMEADFVMGVGDVSLSSMDGLNFMSESGAYFLFIL